MGLCHSYVVPTPNNSFIGHFNVCLVLSTPGNCSDLLSGQWSLACHRAGPKLQGSGPRGSRGAQGEGGQYERRFCPKGLGRGTGSKPKGQTWGQWCAANLSGGWIGVWAESEDSALTCGPGGTIHTEYKIMCPPTNPAPGEPPTRAAPMCHPHVPCCGPGSENS